MSNYFYKNLYEILEIEPTDDSTKIKSAYRKLARKYHPDLNGGNSLYEEKFKEISQACEVLMDKDKKSLYDAFKGYKMNAKTVSPDAQKAKRAYSQASKTATHKTSDNLNEKNNTKGFSDVLNDVIEGLFKEKKYSQNKESYSSSQYKNQAKRKLINGTDINSEVEITYQEALLGTNRTVNILHTDICPNCEGRAFLNGSKCPMCNGLGETSIHKKINVKIPQGVRNSAKIRLAGEGNRGRNGGKNGDVYLIVKVKEDDKFIYDGLNAEFSVTIYPHEAVFGSEIKVQTPQGSVVMKIPANTTQGQKFRLSSHGLRGADGKIGDAIVTACIDLPKELTDEELALYKKLDEISKNRVKEERI